MRNRALSWTVAAIGAVVLMVLVSGCGGAEGIGVLSAILPGGITEPAGIAIQGNLPIKVALYGPEGVGPYQEFQCSIESPISVMCDFSGFLQNRTPDRTFFGLIFPEGWGYIVGANGPRSGALEVVDGNAHGFRTNCPPGCQTVRITTDTGGRSGPALQFSSPASGTVFDVERINDSLVRAVVSGGSTTPPPPQDSDGDGVPDGQDQCPTVRGNPPSGCPPQNPPPGDGGTYYGGATLVTQSGDKWAVFMREIGLIQMLSIIQCPGMMFGSANVGAEEFSINLSGCSFRDTYQVYRAPVGWFTTSTGCFDILNNGAQLGTSRCPKGGGTQPPPSGGSCGLARYDTSRNGIYEDNEILEAVRQWVLDGLTDDCILKAIKLWVRGEQIGTQGDDSSLTQSELAKIRQTLGDPVADLLIRMEQ